MRDVGEGWSDYYGEGAPWMPGDGMGDADMGDLGAGDRGVIVAPSGLNVRAQPLATAPIVGALPKGAIVEILGEGGAPVDDASAPYRGAPWFMVRNASGSVGGWLTGEWVAPSGSPAPIPAPAVEPPQPPLMPLDDPPRQARRFPEEPPTAPLAPGAKPGVKAAEKPWYESPAVKVGVGAALLAGVVYVGSKYL